MAIDTLILVRKRIGDDKKTETESIPISDTTTTVQLAFGNATIFSLYDKAKSSSALVVNVDYTWDGEAGVITLLYTPSVDSVMTAVYFYYAFTDTELNELIDDYGVNGACIEAIRWLIADSARLHDYSRGATSESLSQIIKNLQSMLKDYTTALGSDPSGAPALDMKIMKRTNDYYRGTRPSVSDLSRDDSLSI